MADPKTSLGNDPDGGVIAKTEIKIKEVEMSSRLSR
jgi:hypothetical protein